jgi:hypothetical protein
MIVGRFFRKTGHGLIVAAAILAAIGLTTVPRSADAGGGWGGGGISPGAAVGLGLGAFALGSVLSRPYYNPYYYPYGYYGYYPQAPAYYPPVSYYPPARSCWSQVRIQMGWTPSATAEPASDKIGGAALLFNERSP